MRRPPSLHNERINDNVFLVYEGFGRAAAPASLGDANAPERLIDDLNESFGRSYAGILLRNIGAADNSTLKLFAELAQRNLRLQFFGLRSIHDGVDMSALRDFLDAASYGQEITVAAYEGDEESTLDALNGAVGPERTLFGAPRRRPPQRPPPPESPLAREVRMRHATLVIAGTQLCRAFIARSRKAPQRFVRWPWGQRLLSVDRGDDDEIDEEDLERFDLEMDSLGVIDVKLDEFHISKVGRKEYFFFLRDDGTWDTSGMSPIEYYARKIIPEQIEELKKTPIELVKRANIVNPGGLQPGDYQRRLRALELEQREYLSNIESFGEEKRNIAHVAHPKK